MKLLRSALRSYPATARRRIVLLVCCVASVSGLLQSGVDQLVSNVFPMCKQQPGAAIEARIKDLLDRTKLEENVRQCDLYAGAPAIMSEHADDTHAAKDSVFLPEKAEALWSEFG